MEGEGEGKGREGEEKGKEMKRLNGKGKKGGRGKHG